MNPWVEPQPVPVPPELRAAVGGHPLSAEILARRGFTDPALALAYLDPNAYQPSPPEEFPGMDIASARIERALARGERIWIWGDFDVDGQTSTALLVETLRLLGAEPGYHIPVRKEESHGVNILNLQAITAQGADLLITCDTGITAHEALAWAQTAGLEVIVTDHHALGESLPPALAHITPRLLPPGHPLGTLPGVGVAYKLAEALLARAGRAAESARLLDLVALGIVADVALQTGDARYLLQRGLDRLRRTERAGLRAMLALAEVQPAWLSEEHIGFALGPRLNALGRLSDANSAVELLTTGDTRRADVLAQQLEALNAQRQLLTRQVLDGALRQIERDPALLDSPILILAHAEWPAGVIGIVASQLVERYSRPVLLLSAPPGLPARGSARSVEGIDVTACIGEQQALLAGFGGHPMAAGLALPAENIPALRKGLARSVQAALERAESEGKLAAAALVVDAWLELDQVSLELAEDLGRLGPFGAGNPSLVFAARGLRLVSTAPIGRGKEHLSMTVEDPNGMQHKALWWGGAAWPLPEGRFELAYSLRASNYRGQREISIEWAASRPLEEGAPDLRLERYEIVDHRAARHPRPILDALLAQGGAVVWAEGEARARLNGLDRCTLVPAATLVVWTQPPGRAELQAALEAVHPRQVVLFAAEPGDETPNAFLTRLAGLVNHVINHAPADPVVALRQLAAACAQREAATRLGLRWLQAEGKIKLELSPQGDAHLTRASAPPDGNGAAILEQLKIMLTETAAYRRMYATAPAAAVIS
jgi:single-stranded-DNA-specific exonuclease